MENFMKMSYNTQDVDQNNLANASLFQSILDDMLSIYRRKNADYGDSFTKTLDEFGLVSGLIRISDKLERLKTLIKNDGILVKDESITDTLTDMANYAVMLRMYIENKKICRNNKCDDKSKDCNGDMQCISDDCKCSKI